MFWEICFTSPRNLLHRPGLVWLRLGAVGRTTSIPWYRLARGMASSGAYHGHPNDAWWPQAVSWVCGGGVSKKFPTRARRSTTLGAALGYRWEEWPVAARAKQMFCPTLPGWYYHGNSLSLDPRCWSDVYVVGSKHLCFGAQHIRTETSLRNILDL